MNAKRYFKEGCKGCKFSQEPDTPTGGLVYLEDDWTLNQYGSSEAFLGWMALQPRYHIMEIKELNSVEAAALGRNIQTIDRALHDYWLIHFPDDRFERVYVVYFFESAFGNMISTTAGEEYHMHIHLIPRPASLGKLLRGWSEDGSVYAWGIHKIAKRWNFPQQYKRNEQNVTEIMAFLRERCGKPHK